MYFGVAVIPHVCILIVLFNDFDIFRIFSKYDMLKYRKSWIDMLMCWVVLIEYSPKYNYIYI